MGILSIISEAKNKFKNKATKEEVEGYRQKLVAGDIEVYDANKRNIGEMISSAKQKFKQTKNRMEMMKEEHREVENKKLKSELENLRLKNKVAIQRQSLQKKTGRGLRAVFGGVNIPTAQQRGTPGVRLGGEPFPISTAGKPGTKKNIVQQPEPERNELGGIKPFG
jgi:hypothetical protein